MKIIFLSLFLSVFISNALKTQNIFINYDIDTSVYKVGEPLGLWLDFLNTKDDSSGAKYWNREEVDQYGATSYFLAEYELQFGVDNFLKLLSYADIKILSIREAKQYFKITSLMEFPAKTGTGNVQYIFHVYAGEVNGKLKLFNPLGINSKLYLKSTTIGYINFHYPKSHVFNEELAEKQADFLVDFSEEFQIPLDSIDYYFAASFEEIQQIKGFDFIIGDNGRAIPSGKSDAKNRIVYSAGLGEYYPHEFIHVLLYPHFLNAHFWFNEGLATYLGQSRGKDLEWHLERLNKHLLEHPEINLNNMLELRTIDQYTDYRYVLGGLLMQMAYEKGGVDHVKKMLNSGTTKADFYAAIKNHLGIERDNLNQVIRDELNKEN